MKKYTIFYALLFVVSSQVLAQSKCVDLFGSTNKKYFSSEEFFTREKSTDENLDRVFKNWETLDNLDHDLISGLKSPTWEDFDALSKVESNLKEISGENAPDSKAAKDFQEAVLKFSKTVNVVKSARESQTALFKNKDVKYGPTDYGLRVAYLEKLQAINKYLPNKLQFVKYKIPADLNKIKVVKDAKELVAGLAKMHDSFMEKEGFKSHEELKKQVGLSEESVQLAQKALESDEFDFAMLRPTNGRFWIEKIGFHNQYVTRSSKGYMGDIGRKTAEGSYINEKYEAYNQRDLDLMPKYGFLRPKVDSKVQGAFPHYGEDLYFFKKNTLEDRVTFTLGDSLNALYSINKWNYGRNTEIYEPTKWDLVFTPWSRKEVLAPFIAESLKSNFLVNTAETEKNLGEKNEFKLSRSHSKQEYIELQYWGSLNLDNVKAFAFTTAPPSGEFLKKLVEKNIVIYDYTDRTTYKVWNP